MLGLKLNYVIKRGHKKQPICLDVRRARTVVYTPKDAISPRPRTTDTVKTLQLAPEISFK